jgi:hypothetical protein
MSNQPAETDPGPSPNRGRVSQAQRYIAENRARYDEGVLRSRLAEHGYSEAEIQAAFDETDWSSPSSAGEAQAMPLTMIMILLVLGVVIALLLYGTCMNARW